MRVGILSSNGKISEIFESEKEAAKELNVTESSIRRGIYKGFRVKGYHLVGLEDKK